MEKMEKLLEMMGADMLLTELIYALSEYELNENADYIAQMNDINIE